MDHDTLVRIITACWLPATSSSIDVEPGSTVRVAMRSMAGRLHGRALAKQEFPARLEAVGVPAVARVLLGAGRIVGHVEQLRAVAVAAEHVECHEAGTGKIALVAEDAVELQRMADRFVDLQHHL